MAGGPYCVENDVRGSGNVNLADIQRPPSYFEVIGFFDPPPSYNDVLRVGGNNQQQVEANQVRRIASSTTRNVQMIVEMKRKRDGHCCIALSHSNGFFRIS